MLLTSCGLRSQSFDAMVDNLLEGSVKLIQADSLNVLLNTKADIIVLDARESSEYNVSHVKDAISVGYSNFI